MLVTAGQQFTTSLVDPAGVIGGLGARVEAPITRAVVSYWRAATLNGGLWTVTLDAPLVPGDFLLVWMTGDSPPSFGPVFVPVTAISSGDLDQLDVNPPVDVGAVRPSVQDVAALERTRTVDESGVDQIAFTATTRPAFDEVDSLIDQATQAVLAQLRAEFSTDFYPQVRHAIALYTAILVEGSFYREQLTEGSAQLWRTLFTSTMSGLTSSIERELQHSALARGLEPTPLPPPPTFPR